jgi:hypothetical protein
MVIKLKLGWAGAVVCLLATQAIAKDLQVILWNSTDCNRVSPDSVSIILDLPRDTYVNTTLIDGKSVSTIVEKSTVACRNITNLNLNGWPKGENSELVTAYVDTRSLEPDCNLIFYNKGPSPGQYPEEIALGVCWQAYRRLNRNSMCRSVDLDANSIAVS